MNTEEAIRILENLHDGIDPVTGEVLAEGNVLEQAPVMRAIYMAIIALRQGTFCDNPLDDLWTNIDGGLNKTRPWTDAEDKLLVELYRNGMTMEQLADKLIRKPRGIKDRLSALDVLKPPKEKIKGFERAGEQWLEDEDKQLISFIKHGVPVEIIAKEMRRSDYGIVCRMEKLGFEVTRFEHMKNQLEIDEDSIDIQARPWNKRDDERLIHFYKAGMSFEQLAQKFFRHPKEIENRLGILGFLNAPRIKTPGLERAGEPWTDEENEMFLSMAKQGISAAEIAKQLRRTETAIQSRIDRLVRRRIL